MCPRYSQRCCTGIQKAVLEFFLQTSHSLANERLSKTSFNGFLVHCFCKRFKAFEVLYKSRSGIKLYIKGTKMCKRKRKLSACNASYRIMFTLVVANDYTTHSNT